MKPKSTFSFFTTFAILFAGHTLVCGGKADPVSDVKNKVNAIETTMADHQVQSFQRQQDSSPESATTSTKPTTRIRVWLVRHGETIANRDGLVVGQWDSPLSDLGQHQSEMLGRHIHKLQQKVATRELPEASQTFEDETDGEDGCTSSSPSSWFSRIYSSDLGRTKQTAKAVIAGMRRSGGEEHGNDVDFDDNLRSINNDKNNVIFDYRLREIAKGVRQEFPKTWTTQQAHDERIRLQLPTDILQETTTQAWNTRFVNFLTSIVIEIYLESMSKSRPSHTLTSDCDVGDVEDVLIVSHAGSIRTILQHLVPDADPSLQHKEYDPNCPPDDSRRLVVPNTSVTVLEVSMNPALVKVLDKECQSGRTRQDGGAVCAEINKDLVNVIHHLDPATNYADLWATNVVEFMWTGHLEEMTTNDE